MTETEPVDFYIYADEASFRDAIGPGVRENVGGLAVAGIRTLFALIPPSQIDDAWVGIVIPHELTHLVFDTASKNPYHFPPHWLNEGLAVYVSQGYDRVGSVDRPRRRGRRHAHPARRADRPVPDHGRPLPAGLRRERVGRRLHRPDVPRRTPSSALIRSYADGRTDDEAFKAALGVDMTAFGDAWLADVKAKQPTRYGPQPAPSGPRPGGVGRVGRRREPIRGPRRCRPGARAERRGVGRARRRHGRRGRRAGLDGAAGGGHRGRRRRRARAGGATEPAAGPATVTSAAERLRAIPSWQVTLGVALLALGFLIAAQLASEGPRVRYTTQERTPLVETATGLQTEQDGLKTRILQIRAQIQAIESEGEGAADLVKQLNARLEQARIAAGLIALTGSGIVLQLEDSKEPVPPGGSESDYLVGSRDIRVVVEQLWGAGAEAIAVNGERITPTSAIIDIGTSLLVNSAYLAPPYQVSAIGPADLYDRLSASPGFVDFVRARSDGYGIRVSIAEPQAVDIPAFVGTVTLRYSRPIASPSAGPSATPSSVPGG